MSEPAARHELNDIHESIWRDLILAPTQPAHPWRLPGLATNTPSGPRVRTVVLREADAPRREFAVHTDARSPKIHQLADDPRVALLFWNPDQSTQLAVRGTAVVEPPVPLRTTHGDLHLRRVVAATWHHCRRGHSPRNPATISPTKCSTGFPQSRNWRREEATSP